MSKYHLTEAYGNLYNPRKADETFYENLRFVDYLMQEEIEEVMESLLWEFMDYGNTLDESYDLIEGVFSDDVILEEALYEARMSPRQKAERAARVGGERQATLSQIAGEKAQARKEARKAAITGALKSAGRAVKGAATGTASAAMGAMRAGKQAAAGAYERAKGLPGKAMAALKGLVRKGAAAAIKQGRGTERAGEQARKQAQTAAGGASYAGSSALERSRARTAGLEAAGKIGSKRRAVGRLLQKAGKAVAGAMKSRMSRGDYEQRKSGRADAARQAVGDPFGGSSGTTSVPKTPELGLRKLEASGKKQAVNPAARNRSARRRLGTQLNPATPLTKKGKEATSPITIKAQEREQIKKARESQRNEEFELLAQYIMEDFINEGYADTYEEALEILENLSESSIIELTEMYLEG